MKILALILSTLLLAACGGGGDSSVTSNPSNSVAPEPLAQLALMVDSLGRTVSEADFGGGDGGAAGADGSAGDGKPIPNAVVTLRDNAGRSVSATTDALGYYRVSVKGFTPPFIAKVVRADGSAWYSPSVMPVKVRGFVTVNLTGLTDKLASDVATAAGVTGGAAQLTSTTLAASTAALQTAKTNLATQLATKITAAGLNPATFDPVTTPYKAVVTDSYDKLLESVAITKDANGLTVVTVPVVKTALVGNWEVLCEISNQTLHCNDNNPYVVPAAAVPTSLRNYLLDPPRFTDYVIGAVTYSFSPVTILGTTGYRYVQTFTGPGTNYSQEHSLNEISLSDCGSCGVGSRVVHIVDHQTTTLPGGVHGGQPYPPAAGNSGAARVTTTYTRIN